MFICHLHIGWVTIAMLLFRTYVHVCVRLLNVDNDDGSSVVSWQCSIAWCWWWPCAPQLIVMCWRWWWWWVVPMIKFLASVSHPKLPEVFIVNSDSYLSNAVSYLFNLISSCIVSFLTDHFLSVFAITVNLIFRPLI